MYNNIISKHSTLTVIHFAIFLEHDGEIPLAQVMIVVPDNDLALKILLASCKRHLLIPTQDI